MDFTGWTERFSVGDPLMDAYHHIFFKTLEDLGRELDDLSPDEVREWISFLLNYASMHFDSEEQLMRQVGFPEVEAHRDLHRAFQERLQGLQQCHAERPAGDTARELFELSEAWLRQHILEEDMKYKPYLKG